MPEEKSRNLNSPHTICEIVLNIFRAVLSSDVKLYSAMISNFLSFTYLSERILSNWIFNLFQLHSTRYNKTMGGNVSVFFKAFCY